MADMSELFLRSYKLLQLTTEARSEARENTGSKENEVAIGPECLLEEESKTRLSAPRNRSLQDIVRGLMTTLLETYPDLLSPMDLVNLKNADYCRRTLGLDISNLPLLRDIKEGKEVSGHSRYWRKVYGGSYFVSSQWWKDHHSTNANGLQSLVSRIIHQNEGHPGTPSLQDHWRQLNDYIRANQ